MTRISRLVALLTLAAGGSAVAADPDPIPPDLALVPPSAAGFVHVRAADVWKSPLMDGYRAMLAKAGPKAFAQLDAQFAPKPSTLDRVTVALVGGDAPPGDQVVIILYFTEAFDPTAVRKSAVPGGKERKLAGGKTMYVTSAGDTGLYVATDRVLVVGEAAAVERLVTAPAAGKHPLGDALRQAAGTDAVTAAVTRANLPMADQMMRAVPEPFRAVGTADLALFSVKLGAAPTATLRLTYPTPEDAIDAEKAVRAAAAEGRKALAQQRKEAEAKLSAPGLKPLDALPEALGNVSLLALLNTADEYLAAPPLARADATLTATVTIPTDGTNLAGMYGVSLGMMLPAVQKVREAAARAQASNNLKQIALAMHNHESAYNKFPAAAICDKAGKPLLSWRVAILPFIEQENLYKQFKLDEPWDSVHNSKLIPLMPKVYLDPRTPHASGRTYYKVFTGPDASFDLVKGRTIVSIADGSSNTILVAAGGDPVIWTKPDDIPFDKKKPAPDLTTPFEVLLVAFGDGSVRTINLRTLKNADATLKLLIDPNDGMVIPDLDK